LRPPALIAALALLAALYEWALFATTFTHPGAIGPNYNTPGTDWMVFYSAAHSYWQGHLAVLADGERFTALLNQSFSAALTQPLSYRPWIAPPSLLLVLLPFGLLGFAASYALFQLASAGALLGSLRVGASDAKSAWAIGLAAILCPAAALGAVDGQTGFFITALLIGGFRLMDKRPIAAMEGAARDIRCRAGAGGAERGAVRHRAVVPVVPQGDGRRPAMDRARTAVGQQHLRQRRHSWRTELLCHGASGGGTVGGRGGDLCGIQAHPRKRTEMCAAAGDYFPGRSALRPL
jgi:hypothetical protein